MTARRRGLRSFDRCARGSDSSSDWGYSLSIRSPSAAELSVGASPYFFGAVAFFFFAGAAPASSAPARGVPTMIVT